VKNCNYNEYNGLEMKDWKQASIIGEGFRSLTK